MPPSLRTRLGPTFGSHKGLPHWKKPSQKQHQKDRERERERVIERESGVSFCFLRERRKMGQVVKRKKKGRPSKADLARRPLSQSQEPESEVRRSIRRRNVRYDIDYYEDYFDEEDDEEEEERRREKKLKLVVKLNQKSESAEPARSRSRDGHASEEEEEEEGEEDNKPLKKRKINGGDFSGSEEEDDDNNNYDEEVKNSIFIKRMKKSRSAEILEIFQDFCDCGGLLLRFQQ